MDCVTYEKFVEEILKAEKAPARPFEVLRCFEACLPIEMLAERGRDTLAFGPMKPVGLEDPRIGRRPACRRSTPAVPLRERVHGRDARKYR